MTKLYITIATIFIVGIVILLLKARFDGEEDKEKPKYRYARRHFFMSRAEHEFYDTLVTAVGDDYYIFAQVHLSTLLDEKVFGQNWIGARGHIDRKSVDFVLCDKTYLSPKLAIELDDKSHEEVRRQERDVEVERILKDAGVPLLRIENHGSFNPADLSQKIKEAVLVSA